VASRPTLSTIRTNVRHVLDEATASFWSNAQIALYINQAKDRVWNEVRGQRADYFLKSVASGDGTLSQLGESYDASGLAVTASGTELTLPIDFAEFRLLHVTTSGYEHVPFKLVTLNDPRFRAALEYTTAQDPVGFYAALVNRRTLRYAPLSSVALATKLSYVYQPIDLSADGDSLDMPYPLELAVEWYTVATALLQDRAPESAVFEQRARAVIAEVTGAQARQTQDPVFVQDAWT
jgi:hypothetical protein